MSIPFSQVKPQSLKLKTLPRFPGDLVAGAGIRIDKEPGSRTVSVDFANLERDDITDLTGLYVGTWDASEKIFKLVKSDGLVGPAGPAGPAGDVAIGADVGTVQFVTTQAGDNKPVPLVQVLNEYPPSVERYRTRAGNSARTDTETLNAALTANRAVSLQYGRNYGITSTIFAQSECVIWGSVETQNTITRIGVWNGDTLQIGQNLVGQGAYAFDLKGIKFKQDHTGFVAGTSTVLPNRLTNGQAHLRVWGGTYARIDKCTFDGCVIGLQLLGAAYPTIVDCNFSGYWDSATPGLQETFASVQLTNDPVHGLTTVPLFDRCTFSGVPTPTRSITIGSATFSSHQDGGPAYHFYVEGAEGMILRPKYIGAANSSLVYFNPNSICTNIDISGGFWDSATEAQIKFDSSGPSYFTTEVSIRGLALNSQQLGLHGIFANNSGGSISVAGLSVVGCTGQGWNKAPLMLMGAQAAQIVGNRLSNGNTRNGGNADATFASGAYIGGNSNDVNFSGNKFGGGLNSFVSDTTTKWGMFFTGALGSSCGDGANLGIGGGSVVAGISPTFMQGQGSYQAPISLAGSNYIWVNGTSGKLYKKVGSLPSSDTDGVVVGTET